MNYSEYTYYAHSMIIYGSFQEKVEIGILESMGFKVVCPNNHLHLGNDMDAYLRIVAKCKNVVCSEYVGFIGKGVYLELKWAIRKNIPCYVLRDGKLYHILKVSPFNTQDWQTTYGKITEVEEIEIPV